MNSMARNKLFFRCILLFAALSSAATQAAVVAFEDVVPTSVIDPCFGTGVPECASSLDSTGFRFTSPDNTFTNHAHLVSSPWFLDFTPTLQSYPSNGTQYIGLDPSIIVMSRIDSAPFRLSSFDAAEGFLNGGAPIAFASKLLIEGNVFGGGTMTFTIDFDGVNDGVGPLVDFQTFALPTTFTNLSSVTFSGLTANGEPGVALFSLDNITVPEPATIILLLSGLGILFTRFGMRIGKHA